MMKSLVHLWILQAMLWLAIKLMFSLDFYSIISISILLCCRYLSAVDKMKYNILLRLIYFLWDRIVTITYMQFHNTFIVKLLTYCQELAYTLAVLSLVVTSE